MFERKKYKQFALIQLKGRWGVPIFVTFITALINALFSLPLLLSIPYKDISGLILSADFYSARGLLVNTIQNQNPSTLLDFVSSIVSFIILFVTTKLYIKLSQSPEKVTILDYIQNFTFWWRGILTGLWETLWLVLWCLIIIPFAIIFSIIFVPLTEPSGQLPLTSTSVILSCIIIILVFIILIVKGLAYSMITCIAAEHENCSIPDALRISTIITKGHKWDLFVMNLSFIGWSILSRLTLGIGNLWLVPYMNMTKINAYHALLKMAFEENKIHVEDFGK